ncbi:MAG TPA: hypothetical protein VGS23_03195 [Thermoplasmata archaeon]|nr:hypothetical protein [Thermoplasmata archaeon]
MSDGPSAPAYDRRLLTPKVSTIDLDGMAGRVLFPSLEQGPWLPVERFAESRAVGEPASPDPHPHRQEEVVNYVLSGRMRRTGPGIPEARLEAGSVSRLTARGTLTHDVQPSPGSAARWISIMTRLPPETPPGPPPFEETGTARAVELDEGVRRANLVGAQSPLPSLAGLELADLTIPRGSTYRAQVGAYRRTVVYVVDGSGVVETRPMAAGAGLLAENLDELRFRADSDYRVLLATVPTPGPSAGPGASDRSSAP